MPADNLPQHTTRFIGRVHELNQLVRLMSERRLLTLVGPGGAGKTRLAIETVRHIDFAGEPFFVPLQPITQIENIVSAIVDALPLQLHGSDLPKSQLLNYLADKKMLILLDNFEHLLDAADIVSNILSAAPEVKIIVTSRERLNLQAEQIWNVQGLDIPKHDVSQSDAIELFIEHATRVQPDFDFEQHRDDVIRICQLVDGLPLAIELAANWIRAMSPAAIIDHIQTSIDFLATNQRDIPQRHRSMLAVWDHSWDLLTKEEQSVLRKLSVFRGGFTAEAAKHVAGASVITLAALVDKSLVQISPEGRYDLHELIRQYAEQKLADAGETNSTLDAHCTYFAEFMHDLTPALHDHRQIEALNAIEVDFENVRQAWIYSSEQPEFENIAYMIDALDSYTGMSKQLVAFLDLLQKSQSFWAAHSAEVPHLTEIRLKLAQISKYVGTLTNYDFRPQAAQIRKELTIILETVKQFDALALLAYCTDQLARIELKVGDYQKALNYYLQCAEMFALTNNLYQLCNMYSMSALCYSVLGHTQEAAYARRKSIELANKTRSPYQLANCLFREVWPLIYVQGKVSDAWKIIQEIFELAKPGNFAQLQCTCWYETGFLSLVEGNLDRAAEFTNNAIQLSERLNLGVTIDQCRCLEDLIKSLNRESISSLQLPEDIPRHHFFRHFPNVVHYANFSDRSIYAKHLHAMLNHAVTGKTPGLMHLCIAPVAIWMAWRNQSERAVSLIALARTCGFLPTGWMDHWVLLNELHDDLREKLGEEAYAAAWEHGTTLELEPTARQLLTELQAELGITPSAKTQPLIDPLSDRELEILGLVAEGLTNREIAERLYISVKTVKRHNSNIFGKLQVDNRTQAANAARELGLLSR